VVRRRRVFEAEVVEEDSGDEFANFLDKDEDEGE
jgi:hypothetical protein